MKQPRPFYLLLALLAGVSLGFGISAGPLNWIGRMAVSAAPPQEEAVTIQELGPAQEVEESEMMASTAQTTEDLLVDDGSVESVLQLNQPGTISLVNRLQPSMYPATLSELQIFFASGVGLTPGTPITLLVGSNPDGDANINGTAFQQVNATIQSLGQLNVYSVAGLNVTINSGDFVVGFRLTTQANVGVGALDTTPPSRGRSYFSTDGVNFTSVDTLGGGNLIIRARTVVQQQPPGGVEALVASYIDATRGDNGTGDLTILNNLSGAGAVDGNILTQGSNAEVVVAPNGQYAIAHPTGLNADSISIITGLNAGPVETQVIPIGNFPNAVAISADSTTAIVVNALTSPITYRVITGLPHAPVVSGLFSIPSATNTVAEDAALSPSGDTALISLFQANQVVVIDGVRSGSPGVRGIVNVGSGPNGIAFLPNGNTAFVANTLDNSIEVISGLLPSSLPFGVRRIPVPGPNPQAIQLTPDGAKLVATNTGGNTVSIFQVVGGDNLNLLQTLTVGQNPAGLAVSPDGRTALVANAGSNTVSIIRGLDTASAFVGSTLGPSAQLDTTTFVERSVALAGVAGPPAVPDIDVTPTSLNFGNVTVGASADLTVTVRNVGTAPLTVFSITSNNARFTVVSPVGSFTVAAGGQQVVTVRFTPNAVGVQNGTLTINSNDPDEANVFVTLSGNGQPAGDVNEPNDSPQQTTLIPTPPQGQSVSIMGDATPDDLGTAADQFNTECPPPSRTIQDWFRLEVNQRAAFQLSLSFSGANIDFDLFWFIQNSNFPQGVQLMAVSLQGVGQPETIGTRVLEPGTYIIGVSRVRRNDASDFTRVSYTLTVTRGLSPELHVLEDVVCLAFADGNVANNGFFVVNRVRPTQYPARLEAISILFLAAQGLPSPAGRPVRIIVFTDPSGSGVPPNNPPLVVNQVVTVGGANQFNTLNLGASGPLITQGDFYVGYVIDTANGIAMNMGRALYANIGSFFSNNGGLTYQQLNRQFQGQPLALAIRPMVNTRPFGKVSASESADQRGREGLEMLRPRVITLDEP